MAAVTGCQGTDFLQTIASSSTEKMTKNSTFGSLFSWCWLAQSTSSVTGFQKKKKKHLFVHTGLQIHTEDLSAKHALGELISSSSPVC